MSAESELSAILSHATSSASSLTASAQGLVNTAVAVIDDPVTLPKIPTVIKAQKLADFNELKFAPIDTKAGKSGIPPFPTIIIPDLPDLIDVAEVNNDFDAILTSLNFPAFRYGSVGNPPNFNTAEPFINSYVTTPTAPNMSLPVSPALMGLNSLPETSVAIQSTEFVDIDVNLNFDANFFPTQLSQFTTSIFSGNEGVRGLDELLSEISDMSNQALGAVFTDWLNLLNAHLTNRYELGTHSQFTALTTAIENEARRAKDAVVDRSGWELPALSQIALNATLQQAINTWTAQAESEQQTDTWEHAQSLFELSAVLYEKLRRAIQELKTKEIELVLEAHSQSIAYAKQITDALLIAFNIDNYMQYDLEYKKAESKLKLFEEKLKIELIKYELVFAQLEIEKLKQEQDGILIEQYNTELQRLDSENKLLAAQITAAKNELELKTLPIEIYELQIRAFVSQVNATQAKVAGLVAEIEGNEAKINAEAAKVKGYDAEVDAFVTEVQAIRAKIQSQKARNDSVLDELQAKVKAALAPIEVSASEAEYGLHVYTAAAKEFLSTAESNLEKAKLDDRWREEEQKGLFDEYKLTREQALTIAGKKLQILKAIADVNNEGSQVMAQMAGGAMSAANGIASVIFSEG